MQAQSCGGRPKTFRNRNYFIAVQFLAILVRERALRNQPHQIDDEVARACEWVENMHVLLGKRSLEFALKRVFDAGDHETHQRLRRIDDVVRVGHLDTEALEEALVNRVEKPPLLAEIADRFGGLLDGNVKVLKALDERIAAERPQCQRFDHFLDLLRDHVALHEIADVEYLAEDALGEQMLDDHFLHRAFRQVRIQRCTAEIEELGEGGPVLGVGLALVADEPGEVLAQLLDSALELLDGLLPLVERLRSPGEEEIEDVDQFVGLGEVGVNKFLAVLVEDGAPRLLEEDVVARVASLELGLDLFFEVVVGILGLPQPLAAF